MEKKQKSLKLNFIMNALLTMSSFVFPLITFPYVSRILENDGVGKVALATSWIAYFSMFAQLGIPTYGIRACAKVRDDREALTRTVHELFFINIVMSILAYGAFMLTLVWIPRLQEERLLYLIVSATILFNAIGMEWLYKGLEQYTYITVRSLIFKFAALILMFVLVHQKSDYMIYGGLTIFASSASSIMNFLHAGKLISLRPVGNYHIRKHLKPVSVFFAMTCATTIYTNLDKVMLGFMATDEVVGDYEAAVKIKVILVSIVTSLGTVLLPRASYYIEHNLKAEFQNVTRKAVHFVMLISLPLMLYFLLFARLAILFLSGEAFGGAVLPMQVIMPTLLLIGLSNILGIQILVPTGRENIVLYSEIAGAVTDLVLNALLIPRLGAAGAAVGTVVAETVVLAYQYIFLRSEVTEAFLGIRYWKIALGLALGCASSIWVLYLHIGVFFQLLISALLFFGVYGITLLASGEPLARGITDQLLRKLHLR